MIIWSILVNTPNINLLALHFKKVPVKNSKEFLGVWSEAKDYVRKVGGHKGSYQANKAERLSEDFSWPDSPSCHSGMYFVVGDCRL